MDDRVYHNDGVERSFIPIQDEGQVLAIEMSSLKVFPIWETTPEVENTRAHIKYAESNFDEIITTIFIIVIGTIGYFWMEITRLRRKYGKIQKESISESSGDNDSNNTENQNAKVTAQEQPKDSTNPTPDNNNSTQDAKTHPLAPKEQKVYAIEPIKNRPRAIWRKTIRSKTLDSRSMGLLWG